MKSDQKIHFSNVKSLYKGQQIIRNGLKLKLRLQGALKSSMGKRLSRATEHIEMLPAA